MDYKITLKTENTGDNIYPNIVYDNIPNNIIDIDKINTSYTNYILSKVQIPVYKSATSTEIKSLQSNQGVYVATDTGHWYYWNGSKYVDGGTFQGVVAADNSILTDSINDGAVTIDKLNNDVFGDTIYTLDTTASPVERPQIVFTFDKVYADSVITIEFDVTKTKQINNWSYLTIQVARQDGYFSRGIKRLAWDYGTTVGQKIHDSATYTVSSADWYANKIVLFFDQGGLLSLGAEFTALKILVNGKAINFTFAKNDYTNEQLPFRGNLVDVINHTVLDYKEPFDISKYFSKVYYTVFDGTYQPLPIYVDYPLLNETTIDGKTIYAKSQWQKGRNDKWLLGQSTEDTVTTTDLTLEFDSDKYTLPSLSIKQINTSDSVVNKKINIMFIGDSVTEGFGAENETYWQQFAKYLLKEDLKYNRTTNFNLIGTRSGNTVSVSLNGSTKSKAIYAEGRSGWGAIEYCTTTFEKGNPFYDNGFSIAKYVERYRNYDDNGTKLTLGNGTGTEVTADNINNMCVCNPDYVVLMLGHNDYYRHSDFETYITQMINNIKTALPNCKILMATTMPPVGCLHKELYPEYQDIPWDFNTYAPYYYRYKDNVAYWREHDADFGSNFYVVPIFNITPTIKSYKYSETLIELKGFDHTEPNNPSNGYGAAHPYKTAHAIWAYEFYAIVKYLQTL